MGDGERRGGALEESSTRCASSASDRIERTGGAERHLGATRRINLAEHYGGSRRPASPVAGRPQVLDGFASREEVAGQIPFSYGPPSGASAAKTRLNAFMTPVFVAAFWPGRRVGATTRPVQDRPH